MKTVSDGNSHVTSYTYNPAGYLASVSHPNANSGTGYDIVQFNSYDGNGNVTQRTDGRGVVTNYTYNDPESLLTAITYPASTSLNVSFGYDGYGRRTSMTDGTGSASYTYDDDNKPLTAVTTYTGLAAKTISYAYYTNGSRQTMTTPAGSFSYTYDGVGRMTGLTNPNSEASSWTYQDNSWLQTQTLGNGAVTTYTLNALGLPTDLVNKTSGGTTLSDFSGMTYDGVGNHLSIAASLPAAPSGYSGTTTYTYDSSPAKDQLTQEYSTRNGTYTNTFGYDSAGNPTTFKGTSNSFNADNQNTAYTFDGNGNPTTYKSTTLTFDAENRMTAYGTALTAGYTGDDLRAWKQPNGSTKTYFLYDGALPVCELDSTGSVAAYNTFGANGLVSRRVGSTSTFHTFDPQGGVAQRLDSSGAIVASSMFDAYGARVSTDGSTDPFSGYGAQWGYYTDSETGLALTTFRYYDPATGRFVNRDPIGFAGGINRYGYTGNNPANWIDPSGLLTWGQVANWGDETFLFGAGGAASDAWNKYRAGCGSGWNVLGRSLLLIGAVGINFIPGESEVNAGIHAAEEAASLARAGEKAAEETTRLYRGIHRDHLGMPDALEGKAIPRGGHSDPVLHNKGNTESEFTSWTTSRSEAEFKAEGTDGVVLQKDFPLSEQIKSPDLYNEKEVLIRGPVSGAKVLRGEGGIWY